jgi:hypothetical protein
MPLRRGDLVIVAGPGDYGKPHPAVVVQSNAIPESHASIVICPMTSELAEADFRITVEPRPEIGVTGPISANGRQAGHDPSRTHWTADRPSRRRGSEPVECGAGARYGACGLGSGPLMPAVERRPQATASGAVGAAATRRRQGAGVHAAIRRRAPWCRDRSN